MKKKSIKAKADDLSDGRVILCPNIFSGTDQIRVVDEGLFLNAAKVNIIFWGSAWKETLKLRRQTVLRDAKKILSSPYMRELEQYGINRPASFNRTLIVDDSEPQDGFTLVSLTELIVGMIGDGRLQGPNDDNGPFLHVVIMPRDIFFKKGKPPQINGFHFFPPDPHSSKKLYIVCVHFAPRSRMSATFSHELIETCTDPERTGIKLASSLPLNGSDEIADICEDDTPMAKVNGVKVQSYWSRNHLSCIIPK
jgi:hypothetical protein